MSVSRGAPIVAAQDIRVADELLLYAALNKAQLANNPMQFDWRNSRTIPEAVNLFVSDSSLILDDAILLGELPQPIGG